MGLALFWFYEFNIGKDQGWCCCAGCFQCSLLRTKWHWWSNGSGKRKWIQDSNGQERDYTSRWTRHGFNVLPYETMSLIYSGFVPTFLTCENLLLWHNPSPSLSVLCFFECNITRKYRKTYFCVEGKMIFISGDTEIYRKIPYLWDCQQR